MKQYLFLLLSLIKLSVAIAEDRPFKVLHLTFHKGCAKEVEALGAVFGFDVATWFIHELPPQFFDGRSQGAALYNIGHERAERIWNLHKETFEQFDAIITSDTAPLARIFLQNGFAKPLIIWICGRFDYSDQESLDCDFPDPEFYQLMNQARLKKNVTVIAYTAFEHYYTKSKGVDIGTLTITPCTPGIPQSINCSSIPPHVVKKNTFFLPPYSNETIFLDFSQHCTALGIPNYCGRYNGSEDLKDFRGIIHLPYAWSNLAFFENIANGIPYFVPSLTFLKKLAQHGNYWLSEKGYWIHENQIGLSEWYQPDRSEIITYFDSWRDLQRKLSIADDPLFREKIKQYAKKQRAIMLERWTQVFNKMFYGTFSTAQPERAFPGSCPEG